MQVGQSVKRHYQLKSYTGEYKVVITSEAPRECLPASCRLTDNVIWVVNGQIFENELGIQFFATDNQKEAFFFSPHQVICIVDSNDKVIWTQPA